MTRRINHDGALIVELEKMPGGLNNEVFAYEDPVHGRVCRKVFKQDGRNREAREWWALTTLDGLGVDFAPKPIRADGAVVDMSWVEGHPMNGVELTPEQMEALFRVLETLYALPIGSDVDPIAGSPTAVTSRLRDMVATASDTNESLRAVRRWLTGPEPVELAGTPLTTFGRGDPNLANCLWHDGDIFLIDWEYAGRTARAYELADHVEHLQARKTDWTAFVDRFNLSADEQHLHRLSRRLLAAYWLLLLQPGTRGHGLNPPGTLEAQERRVLQLFED